MTSQPSSARYATVLRPSLPELPVTITRGLRAPRSASPRAREEVKEEGAMFSFGGDDSIDVLGAIVEEREVVLSSLGAAG